MTKREIEKAREIFGDKVTFKEAEAYLWQNVGTMIACVDLVKEDRAEWLIGEGFIDDESEYAEMVTQGFVDEYPSGIIVWML
jgi:hypothetical protein